MNGTGNRREFLKQAGAATAGLAVAGSLSAESAAQEAPKVLRVAMVSGWHSHARGYAEALAAMEEVQLAAVWDEIPERGEAWAQEMEVAWEPDYGKLLQREDIDAIVCNAASSRHAEVMTAAAKAKKHVFTEKVMALTIDECNQIAAAVRENGVKFGISFPFRTRPESLYAEQAIREGLLGQVTFLRARVAHDAGSANWLPPHFWDPVQTGGGAMMDLGAHPMYLLRWLGGQPKKISTSFTYLTKHEVEDNAISVIEFEGGALGVSETSFMATHSPFSIEITGTEGTLCVGGPDETVRIKSNKLEDKNWQTPELPKALPSPIRMWVLSVLQDKPMPFSLEEGTQLTELMQYAYEAWNKRAQVEIPSRA